MRYLSLFSGIEACSVAWAPLGWECVAVAEIEPWPSRVLAHHYPDVPNLGDVTKVTEEQIAALGRIDVVVFGSPCQDLSVAGKRKGLDGARSGLFFTAMQIVGWDNDLNASTEQMGTLLKGGDGGRHEGVMLPTMQVRRLTPTEAERLQGFPDGFTAIPWRGKPADQCPDGPRYKALGNSMAVPVMRWIGQQIDYAMIWGTP